MTAWFIDMFFSVCGYAKRQNPILFLILHLHILRLNTWTKFLRHQKTKPVVCAGLGSIGTLCLICHLVPFIMPSWFFKTLTWIRKIKVLRFVWDEGWGSHGQPCTILRCGSRKDKTLFRNSFTCVVEKKGSRLVSEDPSIDDFILSPKQSAKKRWCP